MAYLFIYFNKSPFIDSVFFSQNLRFFSFDFYALKKIKLVAINNEYLNGF